MCDEQHVGMGKSLLLHAERIARANGTYLLVCMHTVSDSASGFERIAVIAGVGTREYYRRRGFHDEGHFLLKVLRCVHAVMCVRSHNTRLRM
jgi:elongator complex protein 3